MATPLTRSSADLFQRKGEKNPVFVRFSGTERTLDRSFIGS
ncbi:catalase [Rhizobium sp. SG570]|nr:catalase [Rhizobium sp. SG741]NKJ35132.1 catalase [Rhizobium sp. SG570]NRP87315.1 hypothetical protein [Ensifer adhaerens]